MNTNYTTEGILARLQNGESVETIAAELTENLNDAHDQYVAQKAQSDLAQKKITVIKNLLADLRDICDLWDCDDELYEALDPTNTSDEEIEELVTLIDKMVPTIQKYTALSNQFSSLFGAAEPENEPDSADPIEAFLTQFVR